MQKLICCCVSYFESSDLLQAIPSHSARRSLFEHYVKTRAEEKRKEKRAAQKAAVEGFKQLLEEASEVSWIAFNLIAFFSCDFFKLSPALKLWRLQIIYQQDFDFQDIDHNTDYQTFRKKWGNDPRFEALDRKDREHLLNERYYMRKCHDIFFSNLDVIFLQLTTTVYQAPLSVLCHI
jgi:transcription elongation regulator 1